MLQKSLNKLGFLVAKKGPGSTGKETNVFGSATKSALVRFQNAHKKEILVPSKLKVGNGIVGPNTRNFLNSLPELKTLK